VSLSSLCLQSSVPRTALVSESKQLFAPAHLWASSLKQHDSWAGSRPLGDVAYHSTNRVVESGIPEHLCTLKSWKVPLSPVALSSPAYFHLSHTQFGVSEGAELCFPPEGKSTSSLWSDPGYTERSMTLLTEGFLHAVWEAALISLGCSRCYSSLVLTLSKLYDTQGPVKPKIKGFPLSLIANKRQMKHLV